MLSFNYFALITCTGDDLAVRKWTAADMFLSHFHTENENLKLSKNNVLK